MAWADQRHCCSRNNVTLWQQQLLRKYIMLLLLLLLLLWSTCVVLVQGRLQGGAVVRDEEDPILLRHLQSNVTNVTTASVTVKNWDDRNCPIPDPPSSTIQFYLTKDFMIQKVNVTKELCSLVSQQHAQKPIDQVAQEHRSFYERFEGFTNHRNDQALVAKTKTTGICFVTWQSTVNALGQENVGGVEGFVNLLLDQFQNIDPFYTNPIPRSDCSARNGIIDVYNSTFGRSLRKSIDDCVASCAIPSTTTKTTTTTTTATSHDDENQYGCPLVLGGESIGGSAAIVAAIDLRQYNPEVVTFGNPRAIKSVMPCTAIRDSIANRIYRFINTDPDKYDCVAMQLNVYNELHMGWPILLDGINDFPLATVGLNDNKSRQPTTQALHEWSLYITRVEALVNRNCFPIPVTNGWPDEHYCHYDDECSSRYCNNHQLCQTGL